MSNGAHTGRRRAQFVHSSGHKGKNHQQAPKDPWDVKIDVYLNSVGPAPNYPADFDIQTCLPTQWNNGEDNPQVFFFNDGRPFFRVTFRLWDNTNGGLGSGYKFVADKNDALWSKLGSICPTAGCWDVFAKSGIKRPNDTTITGDNPNDETCLGAFQYVLRVTDGNKIVSLDPGGNNMNGGTGFD